MFKMYYHNMFKMYYSTDFRNQTRGTPMKQMKSAGLLLLLLLLSFVTGAGAREQKVFFAGDKNANWSLSEYASWVELPDGNTALEIRIPRNAPIQNITYGASRELDLRSFRGKQIVISGTVSAKEVPERNEGHRCVKLMLYHRGKTGNRYIPSSYRLWGSFPESRLELAFTVPEDVGKNTLMVGVQHNTGVVLAKDLKLEVKEFYPAPVPIPDHFRCEYSDAVRNAPRLRGAGLISTATPEDIRSLADNGANLVRWWIRYDNNDRTLKSLDQALDRLESLLPEFEKGNLKVIPVLNNLPGGRFAKPVMLGINAADELSRSQSNFQIFFDRELLDLYVRIWEKTAQRFRNSPVIYGYSVMNEPSQFGKVPYDYLYCQYLAAKAIRRIDPEKPIYIAANNWDKADAFAYLKPLPLKNILYEVHMYTPHGYTHQGVGATIENIKRGKFFAYPGKIGDMEYNRAILRQTLQPAVDFQKKYGAKIYCGEFSVIRWAPGGAQYLEDLCSIFEELGWDWSYHCHREWMNWSFEYPSSYGSNKPAQEPTDRQKVLQRYWKKNASASSVIASPSPRQADRKAGQ